MGCSSKDPAELFQSQDDKQAECSEPKASSMFINVSCNLSMLEERWGEAMPSAHQQRLEPLAAETFL